MGHVRGDFSGCCCYTIDIFLETESLAFSRHSNVFVTQKSQEPHNQIRATRFHISCKPCDESVRILKGEFCVSVYIY